MELGFPTDRLPQTSNERLVNISTFNCWMWSLKMFVVDFKNSNTFPTRSYCNQPLFCSYFPQIPLYRLRFSLLLNISGKSFILSTSEWLTMFFRIWSVNFNLLWFPLLKVSPFPSWQFAIVFSSNSAERIPSIVIWFTKSVIMSARASFADVIISGTKPDRQSKAQPD